MRKIGLFAIVTLLLLSVSAHADSVFRGLCWGDALNAIVPSYESNSEFEELGVEVYRKESEVLNLGSVILNRIEYHFFEDQLFRIVVFANNEEDNREAAQAMLRSRYGKHTKQNIFLGEVTWAMSDTTVIWRWPFPGTYEPTITFVSNRLAKALSDYQEEQKAIQAEKDAKSW
jgi:hypothetical protein